MVGMVYHVSLGGHLLVRVCAVQERCIDNHWPVAGVSAYSGPEQNLQSISKKTAWAFRPGVLKMHHESRRFPKKFRRCPSGTLLTFFKLFFSTPGPEGPRRILGDPYGESGLQTPVHGRSNRKTKSLLCCTTPKDLQALPTLPGLCLWREECYYCTEESRKSAYCVVVADH